MKQRREPQSRRAKISKETEKDRAALAEKIKLRRKELGLSVTEAASIAGIGRGTWSKYEAGAFIQKGKGKVFVRR